MVVMRRGDTKELASQALSKGALYSWKLYICQGQIR